MIVNNSLVSYYPLLFKQTSYFLKNPGNLRPYKTHVLRADLTQTLSGDSDNVALLFEAQDEAITLLY